MRLYLAVVLDHTIHVVNDMRYPHILASFAYYKVMDVFEYEPRNLILDSGAFTAWSVGKEVNLNDYADFADRFPKAVVVNLDVIPGEKGRSSTPKERHEGMRQSIRNADFLRSRGLRVMEVFHQDEPLEFLDELCDRLPPGDILGISPRNDVHVGLRIEWQKSVLKHLLRRYKKPSKIPRCHGLAATSRSMLEAFPYFSADSSTWKTAPRYGSLRGPDQQMVKVQDLLGRKITNTQRHHMQNMVRLAIEGAIQNERDMTELWKKRGIVWET
jgi:hypothetical protein